MLALIYSISLIHEERYPFEGGGLAKVSPAALRVALSREGFSEEEIEPRLNGKPLPRSAAFRIEEAGGRVAGLYQRTSKPDDSLREAYRAVRREAKKWRDPSVFEALDAPKPGALIEDAAVQAALDVIASNNVVSEAYNSLPARPTLEEAPTRMVFLDIAADMFRERMEEGVTRYRRARRN